MMKHFYEIFLILLGLATSHCKSFEVTYFGLSKDNSVPSTTAQSTAENSISQISHDSNNKQKTFIGTVTSRSTGVPVSNFIVRLCDSSDKYISSLQSVAGKFFLTAAATSTSMIIEIQSEGFVTYKEKIRADPKQDTISFSLVKLGSISGKALRQGQPIFQLVVWAESSDTSILTLTSRTGDFKFHNLPDGNYIIKAVSKDNYYFPAECMLNKGRDVEGILIKTARGRITGSVMLEQSNKTINGAKIELQKLLNYGSSKISYPIYFTTTSNRDGYFEFDGLENLKYRLKVSYEGLATQFEDVDLLTRDLKRFIMLKLEQESIISGYLEGYKSSDSIEVVLYDTAKKFSFKPVVKIHEDGRFIITGLSEGTYSLVLKWNATLKLINEITLSRRSNLANFVIIK